jgi:hypothetical protein
MNPILQTIIMRKTDKIHACSANNKEIIMKKTTEKIMMRSSIYMKKKSIGAKKINATPKRKINHQFELHVLEAKTSKWVMYFFDRTKSGNDRKFDTKKSVFTTKLLRPNLCKKIIKASQRIAKNRSKEYGLHLGALCGGNTINKDGWSTARHGNATTTDLEFNLFEKVNPIIYSKTMTCLNRLKTKLAQDIFKISPERIIFDDCFVVKYEAGKKGAQDRLMEHRDGSVMTFNILLSNPKNFEGGGTALYEPYNTDIHLKQGYCLSHYGYLSHAGKLITKGDRYILVCFIQIQDLDVRYVQDINNCCTIF